MTVYVDDMLLPARVGRIRARWCHLVTDSPDMNELHTFAARIGLRRSWFQHKPAPTAGGVDLSHYDVTEGKREQAIAAGAVPIPAAETMTVLRRAHQARTAKAQGTATDEPH